MTSLRQRTIATSAGVVIGTLLLTGSAAPRASRAAFPDRLADSTFWRIVSTFSEPSGTFPSENFVSNETEWQYVIPRMLEKLKPGGAYLGVGPEQNFTYIAAFKPQIAFIVDIRRQNMMQHLMYKALMEMSADRVDFLSRLWSRARPEGLDTASDGATLATAFRAAKPDSLLYAINTGMIFSRLVREHGFALTSEDSATIRAVYGVFFSYGPEVSYSSSSGRAASMMPGSGSWLPNAGATGTTWIRGTVGTITTTNGSFSTTYRFTTDSAGRMIVTRDSAGVAVPDTNVRIPGPMYAGRLNMPFALGSGFATFASLMGEDDGTGLNRGWLGSERAFQAVKDMQMRNLIVPVVGNIGGTKALAAVAEYLKANAVPVRTYYTSNVEQYLFQNGISGNFYENVAALPTDSSSTFIRSFPSTVRTNVVPRNPGSRLAQTTSPINETVRAYRNGFLGSYQDLAWMQDR